MSNSEWAFFEPFIAGTRGRGGRPASNHRLILDGFFWIAHTGSPWRDLPEEFGKWPSTYRQFRRWTLGGLWELMLDVLNESNISPDNVQMIDSTIIRALHQAAGAKGDSKTRFWPFKRWLYDQDLPHLQRNRSAFKSRDNKGRSI